MDSSIITSCLLLLLAFCCFSGCTSDTVNQLRHTTVVGTVYCDTCFQQHFSKASRLIPGASVAVECGDGAAKPSFRREAKTNKHGVFRVSVDDVESCSVKLVSSNDPSCAVAASAASTGLRLKRSRNGRHVFSAGFFAFTPLKQKPAQPAFFFFPPIPFVPSPGLPPLPLVPPPSIVPPIIPSPPPSILPPIIPSPPPSIVPQFFS